MTDHPHGQGTDKKERGKRYPTLYKYPCLSLKIHRGVSLIKISLGPIVKFKKPTGVERFISIFDRLRIKFGLTLDSYIIAGIL